jgi:hypothetical protein
VSFRTLTDPPRYRADEEVRGKRKAKEREGNKESGKWLGVARLTFNRFRRSTTERQPQRELESVYHASLQSPSLPLITMIWWLLSLSQLLKTLERFRRAQCRRANRDQSTGRVLIALADRLVLRES